MLNLRYEFARLRTEYFLSGISDRHRRNKRIPPPRYVIWDCSRRCNLHCVHCGASKERYSKELTTKQMVRVVDELSDMKVRMLAVTGGEPLLREDLLRILTHAHRSGLRTGIATNGYLIDDTVAGELKDAGLSSVQVSLDGLESTHNEIRNNRLSFARAVSAIELLATRGIPLVSAATTVTPRNVAELEGINRLLSTQDVRMWRLAVAMPIGRAREADLRLDSTQLSALFDFVRTHGGSGPHITIGENLTFLGEWEKKVRAAPAICPVGFTACCIGVDGNVRGCPEQPDTEENREGSLLERPLSEIWQIGFGRYRDRDVLAADTNCSACKAKHWCYGGCWVMREDGRHCILRLLS